MLTHGRASRQHEANVTGWVNGHGSRRSGQQRLVIALSNWLTGAKAAIFALPPRPGAKRLASSGAYRCCSTLRTILATKSSSGGQRNSTQITGDLATTDLVQTSNRGVSAIGSFSRPRGRSRYTIAELMPVP
ncbi:hypothetical protein GGI42DRAFT_184871 [Trichoderma sp. SZMC 28013]